MHRGGRGRRRGTNIGLVLLALEVMQMGLSNIPPVTLTFLGINVAVFLGIVDHPLLTLRLRDACVSVVHVWYAGDWRRILLSIFYHANDFHLYYNMASFMWKGRSLENRLGSKHFLAMLIMFCFITNIIYVALALGAYEMFGDLGYLHECAVGFSGVIFALKVVTTHYAPTQTRFLGVRLPVSPKYACWVELILIQILVPNVSFFGHLAGILAGILYVYGPLGVILNSMFPAVGTHPFTNRRFHAPAQPTGYRDTYQSSQASNYQSYTGGLDEDAQFDEAMRRSREDDDRRLYPDLSDHTRGERTDPFGYPPQSSAAPRPSAPQPSAPQPSAPQPSAPQPSAPQPSAPPLPDHLDFDDLRRRRLARFDT